MSAEKAGKTLDEVLDSLRRRASTLASGTRKRLRLNKQPAAYINPKLARDPDLVPATLRAAIAGAVAGELPWPLFVYGPVGTGKTRAAHCLLDLAGGFLLQPESLAEWCLDAEKGLLVLGGRPVSRQALWDALSAAQLVVLDDVGASTPSEWVRRQVKRLLDVREGSPLFAVSNFALEKIAQLYDDRVASRLGCGTVLHLPGEDRRLKGVNP